MTEPTSLTVGYDLPHTSVLFGLSPMCPFAPTPLISRSQNPPVHLHNFSFSDYFPCGVGAMLYHPQLNVLLIGSDTGSVSGWRLLDGFPHWAPMVGQDVEKVKTKNVLLCKLPCVY